MRSWTSRTAGVLAMVLCLAGMPGCYWRVETIKIVNESDVPITSVSLIPYHEDRDAQDAAIEHAINLLPQDATGHTIALAPGGTTAAYFLRTQDRYIRSVTFFENGQYQEYVQHTILDLSRMCRNTMIIMRVMK